MRLRTIESLRVAVATAVAALLLPSALHAQEAEAQAAPKASLFKGEELGARFASGFAAGFDAVLLRPIGALKAGVGLALFAPAALLSVAEGRDALKEGWDVLVAEPAKAVFQRPLGDF